MSATGLRVVLTGAARGIGRAMAQRLARDSVARQGEPARMVLTDLREDELTAFAHDLRKDGHEVHAIGADAADPETPQRLLRAADGFNGLDAVVCNAGYAIPSSLLDAQVEDWDRVFALHVRAPWLLARAAHPALKAAHGSVVLTTSISGSQPTAPLAAYSPSKAAALMLVRQMALEWGPDQIRVNALSPGITETPGTAAVYAAADARAQRAARVPLRRIATAQDMANALSFLVGPDAAYITGSELMVDGGLSTVLMGSLSMAGWQSAPATTPQHP